jgi:hypothetical protein
MTDFSKLPIEIINIIINYTDVVVYRNGKYLNRINKNDKRYDVIKKRRLPIYFGQYRWMFYFPIYNCTNKCALEMEHTYNPNNKHHYLSKRIAKKHKNGTITTDEQKDYIFDLQGQCREIVNYTM